MFIINLLRCLLDESIYYFISRNVFVNCDSFYNNWNVLFLQPDQLINDSFKNILFRLILRICDDLYDNLIIYLYINHRESRVYRDLTRYIDFFQFLEVNYKVFIIFEMFFLTRVYLRDLYWDFNLVVYFIIVDVDIKRVMIDDIFEMFSNDFFFVMIYFNHRRFSLWWYNV